MVWKLREASDKAFEEDGLEAQVGDVQAEALKEEPNGGRDGLIPFGRTQECQGSHPDRREHQEHTEHF